MVEHLMEELGRLETAAELLGTAAIVGSKTSISQRRAAYVSVTGPPVEDSSSVRYRAISPSSRRAWFSWTSSPVSAWSVRTW